MNSGKGGAKTKIDVENNQMVCVSSEEKGKQKDVKKKTKRITSNIKLWKRRCQEHILLVTWEGMHKKKIEKRRRIGVTIRRPGKFLTLCRERSKRAVVQIGER